jgi:two-component system response regulator MprA
MLRLEGYAVLTAIDAETALSTVAAIRPDAVLLDLRMPLMDGLALLQRLRALDRDRQTPVAVVTGDYAIDENVADEIRQLDAVICFKPLWLPDLIKIADRLLKTTL